jgi:hypothetical protein
LVTFFGLIYTSFLFLLFSSQTPILPAVTHRWPTSSMYTHTHLRPSSSDL